MSWVELLSREIERVYDVTDHLMDEGSDKDLGWKPSTGSNWMTLGQLLMHCTDACGAPCKGFVTGDWGMPEGMDVEHLTPEQMLPPAEKLPHIKSVAEAKRLLAADRKVALEMVKKAGETKLTSQKAPAPWDPTDMILGHRLLSMVGHLNQHKGQLFYYLKLMGKPVNTGHLWGM